jgi:hypothetical protein
MKTKNFWTICWVINIFYDLLMILIPFLFIYYADNINTTKYLDKLSNQYGSVVIVLGIITFIFWIYNLTIWHKKKDNTVNLLLLIFLNGIYSPIYFYLKVLKKK